MLNENQVVDAVIKHLEGRGYEFVRKCLTTERGIDIVMKEPATGRFLLVEAKGATSDREGSARHGKGFSTAQVRSHVARAFYAAAASLQHPDYPGAASAIALPNLDGHRDRIRAIQTALDQLGILVFFVNEDETVA